VEQTINFAHFMIFNIFCEKNYFTDSCHIVIICAIDRVGTEYIRAVCWDTHPLRNTFVVCWVSYSIVCVYWCKLFWNLALSINKKRSDTPLTLNRCPNTTNVPNRDNTRSTLAIYYESYAYLLHSASVFPSVSTYLSSFGRKIVLINLKTYLKMADTIEKT
jgi:hypothetical protein